MWWLRYSFNRPDRAPACVTNRVVRRARGNLVADPDSDGRADVDRDADAQPDTYSARGDADPQSDVGADGEGHGRPKHMRCGD
jgi:hypothetical protein